MGFVRMKEKAKRNLYKNVDTLGDAYTYVAIERNTKMILAWHLGKRNRSEPLAFILKLRRATTGKLTLRFTCHRSGTDRAHLHIPELLAQM